MYDMIIDLEIGKDSYRMLYKNTYIEYRVRIFPVGDMLVNVRIQGGAIIWL